MTREEQIDARMLAFSPLYRGIYRKAIKGKSLRACINAQCLDCCASQRDEVALCTDLACPLWAVRPYRRSAAAHAGPPNVAVCEKEAEPEPNTSPGLPLAKQNG